MIERKKIKAAIRTALKRSRVVVLPGPRQCGKTTLAFIPAPYAAFEGVPGGRVVPNTFGILVLVLAVWVVVHSPAISWIGWILAALAVIVPAPSPSANE